MKSPTLLIDGDLMIFRSTVVCERDVRWDEENHFLYANEEEAYGNCVSYIDRLKERFNTDKVLVCISLGRNFRYEIDPSYKGNRATSRKPCGYSAVRERVEENYPSFKHDGIEADDVMGIFATRLKNCIIVSADKDMKTIPTTVFDGKTVMKITEGDADLNFFTQVLTGDTADGYPGCPGVGPKRAETILNVNRKELAAVGKLGSEVTGIMWRAIVRAYEKAGLTEADALKQARLARILRDSDWDANAKKPILWTPPAN